MISTTKQTDISLPSQYAPGFHDEMRGALVRARTPRLRSYIEFAEAEIVIGEGKFKGERFRVRNQPFAGLLLRGFQQYRQYRKRAVLGCVQSGKSLVSFAIVVAYHLAEMKETVVLGAPTVDMGKAKWKNEILPFFKRNPHLAKLLPTKGKGSRGGDPDEIVFNNGAKLKFMGAAGGDDTRSSYTTRVVVITEVDKMDTASETSDETDPIEQIISRTESYGEDLLVFLECTVSVPTGRIWREYLQGTGTELCSPCVHCGEYVSPGRKHFRGYEDQSTIIGARTAARFHCPKCEKAYEEHDRQRMIDAAVEFHRGQTVKIGTAGAALIEGELPECETYAFRWNGFYNRLWTTRHIAGGEWKAYRAKLADAENWEALERKQSQFVWATPYEDETLNDFNLDSSNVRRRVSEYSRDIVPPDTTHLTMGVDVGGSTCWWVLLAGRSDFRLHVPAYGAFNVSSDYDTALEVALLNALREFKRQLVDPGFEKYGHTGRVTPTQIWIDAGYQTDVVCKFVAENGRYRKNRFAAVAGRGRSTINPSPYNHPKTKDRTIRELGDEFYGYMDRERRLFRYFFNADYWKLWVQKRLVSDRHLPGSLGFYRVAGGPDAQAHEHAKISNHLCNEKFERVPDPKKGIVEKWVKRGQNHWLDAMAMASAAIRKTGFDLSTLEAIELTFEKLEQFEEAAAAGTLEAEQLEVPSVSMSERFAQLRKGW